MFTVSNKYLLWISFDSFAKRDVTMIILNAPGDLADGCGHEGLVVVSTPAVRMLTRHVSMGYGQHQHQSPPSLANHLQTTDSRTFYIIIVPISFHIIIIITVIYYNKKTAFRKSKIKQLKKLQSKTV